jgi:hypothetical protein
MTAHPPRPRVLAGALLALGLVAAVAACAGPRGPFVQAPVELVVGPVASAPEAGAAADGQKPSSGACSLRLVAARIEKSSPGCFLDEHVSEGPGVLRYPCTGDGPAEAEFGDHRYTGRVVRGRIELELTTELDWEDGCRWGTRAVISGPLVPNGEPVSWRYRDHVIRGSGCSGVCTASALLQVSRLNGRAAEVPAIRDDDDGQDDDD